TSAPSRNRPQAAPTTRPGAPSPTVPASAVSSSTWATSPLTGPATACNLPSCTTIFSKYRGHRDPVHSDRSHWWRTAVKQDEREPFVQALRRARRTAYAPGEYVEQESFMRAGEIRALAERAGIGPGVSVLDVCCGVAGPGRFITRELGCSYLGVDSSASAIDIARDRAGGLPCRFQVAEIPPLPPGTFDVVLLLETMLAFPDKQPLLQGISQALKAGGRFCF